MQRHELEGRLALTAEIVRSNPDVPFMRVPINLMKIERLMKSLYSRYDYDGQEEDYILRTTELEDKARKLALEVGTELRIRRNEDWPFALMVNGVEKEIG